MALADERKRAERVVGDYARLVRSEALEPRIGPLVEAHGLRLVRVVEFAIRWESAQTFREGEEALNVLREAVRALDAEDGDE